MQRIAKLGIPCRRADTKDASEATCRIICGIHGLRGSRREWRRDEQQKMHALLHTETGI